MATLKVIAGPDVGKTIEVRESPVTIGRGPDCHFRITDELVSMIHALVEPIETVWRVRDLESSSGTRVNGEPAAERRLLFGDTITVGATTILFGSGNETVGSEKIGSASAPFPGGVE